MGPKILDDCLSETAGINLLKQQGGMKSYSIVDPGAGGRPFKG